MNAKITIELESVLSITSTCVLRIHSYILVNDILYNLPVIRSVTFKISRDFGEILLLMRETEIEREKERSRNIMRIEALY